MPALIKRLGGPSLCSDPFAEINGECHISSDQFDNLFVLTRYRSGKAKMVRLKYGD